MLFHGKKFDDYEKMGEVKEVLKMNY